MLHQLNVSFLFLAKIANAQIKQNRGPNTLRSSLFSKCPARRWKCRWTLLESFAGSMSTLRRLPSRKSIMVQLEIRCLQFTFCDSILVSWVLSFQPILQQSWGELSSKQNRPNQRTFPPKSPLAVKVQVQVKLPCFWRGCFVTTMNLLSAPAVGVKLLLDFSSAQRQLQTHYLHAT